MKRSESVPAVPAECDRCLRAVVFFVAAVLTPEPTPTTAPTATPTPAPTATPKPKNIPKTGDSAPLALWIGLILVGMIGTGTFIALQRRTRKK